MFLLQAQVITLLEWAGLKGGRVGYDGYPKVMGIADHGCAFRWRVSGSSSGTSDESHKSGRLAGDSFPTGGTSAFPFSKY